MQQRHEIKLAGILGLGAIGIGAAAALSLRVINPFAWTLWAGALWLYCWWQAWRRLHLNRTDTGAPCHVDFGWANRLTLLRGGLIALSGGFLLQPIPFGLAAWIPGLLYGIAAALDRVDGLVARHTGRTTLLGRELDTEMDAVGLLVAPLLAVGYGKLHWSFLAVSAAYYIFIGGLRWRRARRRPVYPLPPSTLRRTLAGFHMGLAALVLLPLFSPAATQLLGVAFMMPMLAGFLVDWLAVSGRINPTGATRYFLSRLSLFGRDIGQPALRLLIGVLVLHGIYYGTAHGPAMVFLQGMLGLLILSGLGARLAAGVLLALCAYHLETVPWHAALLLFACSWVALLGAGRFSLWRGDDIWVERGF